eukprot:CAMPEP_0198586110 /NCGR_PEP_ID=MMETSP1462-20131121/130188_1 /TAXON_ID=1333877 /ORGANISM="Brandtodinium nutriculum, Strain RCC3387" /LENGTH=67 /DNA_ID=CAMNT_0044317555 /DNA_START=15 /DNA_END=215 /DNA_ORIENTATION=-
MASWRPSFVKRKELSQRFIINPERSSFLEYWDVAIMLALAFVSIVAPVQVAMFEPRIDAWFLINCIV